MWARFAATFAFLSIASLAPVALAATVGDCIAIVFSSANCPQCADMERSADQVLEDGWVVRRVDMRQDPQLVNRWQIRSTPTTVLLRNGREVDRILGTVDYREMSRRMIGASSPDRLREQPANREPMMAELTKLSNAIPTSTPISQPTSPDYGRIPTPAVVLASATSSKNNLNGAMSAEYASVRIRIDEAHSNSAGAGTIIDTHDGEALVLTCGHLFRNVSPEARIFIDTFIDGRQETFTGTIIDYQANEADIGLVSFHPGKSVPFARLIHQSKRLHEGDPVFSFGCDQGQNPSKRETRITKLNRYIGESNVEISGAPIQGRSGGGLFNELGELIGVCFAADAEYDEGLYSGPEVVYKQLSRLGLEHLYRNSVPASVTTEVLQASHNSSQSAIQTAAQEMVIIMRDRNGKEHTVQVANPSPQLVQAVTTEGKSITR